MTDTANLGLPCIEGNQAQKHVTHNDALRLLDTLVQLTVLDRDLTDPPASPTEGQSWIVKAGATGAWAGRDNAIASWQDGVWQFSAPKIGWTAYAIDDSTLLAWNGSAWASVIDAMTPTALNNLTLLGVGATADTTNPLSAKLNNALFAAKTTAEGGDGDLRYKLNKEAAGNTLSFLFQDNYSGRAEIGLTGDDDFHFKVSGDGTTWRDGIVVNRTTGAVTFPNTTLAGAGRELMTAARTYYVRADGSDANNGRSNTSGGAFLTLQYAYDLICASLDFGGKTVTIQVADGTYTAGILLTQPWTGGGSVVVQGNSATPSNVLMSVTGGDIFKNTAPLSGVFGIKDLKMQTTTNGSAIRMEAPGIVEYGNVEFGSIVGQHVHVNAPGSLARSTSNYTISGGGTAHWLAANNGGIIDQVRTIAITGTPAFSSGFAWATRGGAMTVNANTFSGSATGPRYLTDSAGGVFTNGASSTYLPGSAAGTATSPGWLT
jgi:hypothetical protein